jgi:hypothetical protein
MVDLTIFTVATGRYLDFWVQLVNSGEEFMGNSVKTQWLVLTDQGEKIPAEIVNKLGPRLSVVPISHEPWPYPTLRRYEYLLFAKDKVAGDYIMHLDADMVFVDFVDELDITKPLVESEIACVSHPGYFRPRGSERVKFYGKNPRKFIQDMKLFLKFGGVGTWEQSASSTAFVPRALRHDYVCGGCWFGTKSGVLEMAESLNRNIELDLQSDFIANFHDESHLNAFIADKKIKILTPEFCYDPGYPQLKDISPKILAVDKNLTTVWVRE